MARRKRHLSGRLNERFFEACREYLSGRMDLRNAAKAAKMAPARFQTALNEAYSDGFLILKGRLNQNASFDLRSEWLEDYSRNTETFVAEGCPDNETFAHFAAEMLLNPLRRLLEDKETVTIGIISGSSTGQTIEQLVESRLWDEVMGDAAVRAEKIHTVALNVTPVVGWELEGNANVAVLRLAMHLREKLPGRQVRPCGLSSTLVVSEGELPSADLTNQEVVRLAEPARLEKGAKSQLDMVITGVGTPEKSIFWEVLKAERIDAPNEMVGDVGFWPVDENGRALTLTRKGKGGRREPCYIYSAIRPSTLQNLVRSKAKVVLIARNKRRDERVKKTAAILAAVRGGYVNFVITDTATADEL